MNKKQLSLQNASLFAELERKAKEMEILKIRLDEAEKNSGLLTAENEVLKSLIEKANSENSELIKQAEKLKSELDEAKSKAVETFAVTNMSEPETPCKEPESNIEFISTEEKSPAEEIFEKFFEEYPENNSATVTNDTEPAQFTEEVAEFTEEVAEFTEEVAEFTEEAAENSIEAADELTEESTASDDIITPDNAPTPPTNEESPALTTEPKTETERSGPIDDLLRDYGARIIGKVTRVTAEVLSKISNVNDEASESLKTLALGKNESFKFQIMELAKRKDDPEKIKAEMDLLADEAIVYLRSI